MSINHAKHKSDVAKYSKESGHKVVYHESAGDANQREFGLPPQSAYEQENINKPKPIKSSPAEYIATFGASEYNYRK